MVYPHQGGMGLSWESEVRCVLNQLHKKDRGRSAKRFLNS